MTPDPMGELRPYLTRIGDLPPLPWFSEADFHEAVAIIREADEEVASATGISAGLNAVLISEVIMRTVRGLEWALEQPPKAKEEMDNLRWLGALFTAVPLNHHEAKSIFCSVWAERVELSGKDLRWWLKYERGVMGVFSNFKISIGHIREDDLRFYVENNYPEYLAGLLLAGFPRATMLSFLGSQNRVHLVRTLALEAEALAAFAAVRCAHGPERQSMGGRRTKGI